MCGHRVHQHALENKPFPTPKLGGAAHASCLSRKLLYLVQTAGEYFIGFQKIKHCQIFLPCLVIEAAPYRIRLIFLKLPAGVIIRDKL